MAIVDEISRLALVEGIRALDIGRNDTVFVQSNFEKFTNVEGNAFTTLLGAFTDVIGEKGTLIAPAYIKPSLAWDKKTVVFTERTPAYTGMFSNLLLRHPGRARSTHPTHSIVAVGKDAEEITASHTRESSCFSFLDDVACRNGHVLLLGCATHTPGFPTVHCAQSKLGLMGKHLIRHLAKVEYKDKGGEVRKFKVREAPSCGNGFDKMYREYIKLEILRTAYVGDAWCVSVRARQAIEADLAQLKSNPRKLLCDRPDCASCRLLRLYNKRGIIGGALSKIGVLCKNGFSLNALK